MGIVPLSCPPQGNRHSSTEERLTGRYLIRGGAGFVGASLVRAPLDRGDQVSGLEWGQAADFADVGVTSAEQISRRHNLAQTLDWFRGQRAD